MISGRVAAGIVSYRLARCLARRLLTGVASVAVITAVVSTGGCRRPHVDGTVAVETILTAWNAGGFDTKAVLNVEPDLWSAGACSRGAINGLDVLICEYSSDDGLAVGEKKILADWEEESVATGAVARTSKTLLAVADRTNVDREGRTIARLMSSFRELHQ